MRDIIFRGKDYNNKWLYGSLNRFTNDEDYIQYEDGDDMVGSAVHMDTVGQFTGLTDKNGTKLFEGDIVKFHGDYIRLIKYSNMMAGFITMYADNGQLYPGCKINHYDDFEIIGNIIDNPELLGVKI